MRKLWLQTFIAAAVRPADEQPIPVVRTALGAIETALNNSFDFAKPGSPIKITQALVIISN